MSALPILPAHDPRHDGDRPGDGARLAPVIQMPASRRRARAEARGSYDDGRPTASQAQRVHRRVVEGEVVDPAPQAASFNIPVKKAVGYLAALALATTVAVGAGLALQPSAYDGPTFTHAVVGGESLWGIAEGLGAQRPVDDVVYDIKQLNGLEGNSLQAGQQIVLPAQ